MVAERAEFSRRHSDTLTIFAQARYRMECRDVVHVWLSDLILDTPKAVSDLDQIQKLLTARPEIVRLSPKAAEQMKPRDIQAKAHLEENVLALPVGKIACDIGAANPGYSITKNRWASGILNLKDGKHSFRTHAACRLSHIFYAIHLLNRFTLCRWK